MSRAFVKEDADTDPVVVPARAPLPEGVPNRMTAGGMVALAAERSALERELERAQRDGDARALASATGRLDELAARLSTAQVVELPDVVTVADVGVWVTLRRATDGGTLRFRIVGVDEADPAHGSVAFTAPVAAAVLGKGRGDVFTALIGGSDAAFEVIELSA